MKQVVIIGGGLAGCASAESFSRRGWQVRVLEARDRLGGAGSSGTIPAQIVARMSATTPSRQGAEHE